ncbi:hypothetical protein DINM_021120 [Dirofilaria immitis]|nr:hypothetical protein [Dirofilaria immitis]
MENGKETNGIKDAVVNIEYLNEASLDLDLDVENVDISCNRALEGFASEEYEMNLRTPETANEGNLRQNENVISGNHESNEIFQTGRFYFDKKDDIISISEISTLAVPGVIATAVADQLTRTEDLEETETKLFEDTKPGKDIREKYGAIISIQPTTKVEHLEAWTESKETVDHLTRTEDLEETERKPFEDIISYEETPEKYGAIISIKPTTKVEHVEAWIKSKDVQDHLTRTEDLEETGRKPFEDIISDKEIIEKYGASIPTESAAKAEHVEAWTESKETVDHLTRTEDLEETERKPFEDIISDKEIIEKYGASIPAQSASKVEHVEAWTESKETVDHLTRTEDLEETERKPFEDIISDKEIIEKYGASIPAQSASKVEHVEGWIKSKDVQDHLTRTEDLEETERKPFEDIISDKEIIEKYGASIPAQSASKVEHVEAWMKSKDDQDHLTRTEDLEETGRKPFEDIISDKEIIEKYGASIPRESAPKAEHVEAWTESEETVDHLTRTEDLEETERKPFEDIISYEETPEKYGAIISIQPTTKVEHVEAWTESKETVDHLTRTEDLEETERKPFEDIISDKEIIEKYGASISAQSASKVEHVEAWMKSKDDQDHLTRTEDLEETGRKPFEDIISDKEIIEKYGASIPRESAPKAEHVEAWTESEETVDHLTRTEDLEETERKPFEDIISYEETPEKYGAIISIQPTTKVEHVEAWTESKETVDHLTRTEDLEETERKPFEDIISDKEIIEKYGALISTESTPKAEHVEAWTESKETVDHLTRTEDLEETERKPFEDIISYEETPEKYGAIISIQPTTKVEHVEAWTESKETVDHLTRTEDLEETERRPFEDIISDKEIIEKYGASIPTESAPKAGHVEAWTESKETVDHLTRTEDLEETERKPFEDIISDKEIIEKYGASIPAQSASKVEHVEAWTESKETVDHLTRTEDLEDIERKPFEDIISYEETPEKYGALISTESTPKAEHVEAWTESKETVDHLTRTEDLEETERKPFEDIISYEETPEKYGAIISIQPTTKVEHVEAWTESKETVDHLTRTEDLEETERKPFEDIISDKEIIEKYGASIPTESAAKAEHVEAWTESKETVDHLTRTEDLEETERKPFEDIISDKEIIEKYGASISAQSASKVEHVEAWTESKETVDHLTRTEDLEETERKPFEDIISDKEIIEKYGASIPAQSASKVEHVEGWIKSKDVQDHLTRTEDLEETERKPFEDIISDKEIIEKYGASIPAQSASKVEHVEAWMKSKDDQDHLTRTEDLEETGRKPFEDIISDKEIIEKYGASIPRESAPKAEHVEAWTESEETVDHLTRTEDLEETERKPFEDIISYEETPEKYEAWTESKETVDHLTRTEDLEETERKPFEDIISDKEIIEKYGALISTESTPKAEHVEAWTESKETVDHLTRTEDLEETERKPFEDIISYEETPEKYGAIISIQPTTKVEHVEAWTESKETVDHLTRTEDLEETERKPFEDIISDKEIIEKYGALISTESTPKAEHVEAWTESKETVDHLTRTEDLEETERKPFEDIISYEETPEKYGAIISIQPTTKVEHVEAWTESKETVDHLTRTEDLEDIERKPFEDIISYEETLEKYGALISTESTPKAEHLEAWTESKETVDHLTRTEDLEETERKPFEDIISDKEIIEKYGASIPTESAPKAGHVEAWTESKETVDHLTRTEDLEETERKPFEDIISDKEIIEKYGASIPAQSASKVEHVEAWTESKETVDHLTRTEDLEDIERKPFEDIISYEETPEKYGALISTESTPKAEHVEAWTESKETVDHLTRTEDLEETERKPFEDIISDKEIIEKYGASIPAQSASKVEHVEGWIKSKDVQDHLTRTEDLEETERKPFEDIISYEETLEKYGALISTESTPKAEHVEAWTESKETVDHLTRTEDLEETERKPFEDIISYEETPEKYGAIISIQPTTKVEHVEAWTESKETVDHLTRTEDLEETERKPFEDIISDKEIIEKYGASIPAQSASKVEHDHLTRTEDLEETERKPFEDIISDKEIIEKYGASISRESAPKAEHVEAWTESEETVDHLTRTEDLEETERKPFEDIISYEETPEKYGAIISIQPTTKVEHVEAWTESKETVDHLTRTEDLEETERKPFEDIISDKEIIEKYGALISTESTPKAEHVEAWTESKETVDHLTRTEDLEDIERKPFEDIISYEETPEKYGALISTESTPKAEHVEAWTESKETVDHLTRTEDLEETERKPFEDIISYEETPEKYGAIISIQPTTKVEHVEAWTESKETVDHLTRTEDLEETERRPFEDIISDKEIIEKYGALISTESTPKAEHVEAWTESKETVDHLTRTEDLEDIERKPFEDIISYEETPEKYGALISTESTPKAEHLEAWTESKETVDHLTRTEDLEETERNQAWTESKETVDHLTRTEDLEETERKPFEDIISYEETPEKYGAIISIQPTTKVEHVEAWTESKETVDHLTRTEDLEDIERKPFEDIISDKEIIEKYGASIPAQSASKVEHDHLTRTEDLEETERKPFEDIISYEETPEKYGALISTESTPKAGHVEAWTESKETVDHLTRTEDLEETERKPFEDIISDKEIIEKYGASIPAQSASKVEHVEGWIEVKETVQDHLTRTEDLEETERKPFEDIISYEETPEKYGALISTESTPKAEHVEAWTESKETVDHLTRTEDLEETERKPFEDIISYEETPEKYGAIISIQPTTKVEHVEAWTESKETVDHLTRTEDLEETERKPFEDIISYEETPEKYGAIISIQPTTKVEHVEAWTESKETVDHLTRTEDLEETERRPFEDIISDKEIIEKYAEHVEAWTESKETVDHLTRTEDLEETERKPFEDIISYEETPEKYGAIISIQPTTKVEHVEAWTESKETVDHLTRTEDLEETERKPFEDIISDKEIIEKYGASISAQSASKVEHVEAWTESKETVDHLTRTEDLEDIERKPFEDIISYEETPEKYGALISTESTPKAEHVEAWTESKETVDHLTRTEDLEETERKPFEDIISYEETPEKYGAIISIQPTTKVEHVEAWTESKETVDHLTRTEDLEETERRPFEDIISDKEIIEKYGALISTESTPKAEHVEAWTESKETVDHLTRTEDLEDIERKPFEDIISYEETPEKYGALISTESTPKAEHLEAWTESKETIDHLTRTEDLEETERKPFEDIISYEETPEKYGAIISIQPTTKVEHVEAWTESKETVDHLTRTEDLEETERKPFEDIISYEETPEKYGAIISIQPTTKVEHVEAWTESKETVDHLTRTEDLEDIERKPFEDIISDKEIIEKYGASIPAQSASKVEHVEGWIKSKDVQDHLTRTEDLEETERKPFEDIISYEETPEKYGALISTESTPKAEHVEAWTESKETVDHLTRTEDLEETERKPFEDIISDKEIIEKYGASIPAQSASKVEHVEGWIKSKDVQDHLTRTEDLEETERKPFEDIISYEETPEKYGAIISIQPTTKVEHVEAWTESKETVDHLTRTEDLEETGRKPFEDIISYEETPEKYAEHVEAWTESKETVDHLTRTEDLEETERRPFEDIISDKEIIEKYGVSIPTESAPKAEHVEAWTESKETKKLKEDRSEDIISDKEIIEKYGASVPTESASKAEHVEAWIKSKDVQDQLTRTDDLEETERKPFEDIISDKEIIEKYGALISTESTPKAEHVEAWDTERKSFEDIMSDKEIIEKYGALISTESTPKAEHVEAWAESKETLDHLSRTEDLEDTERKSFEDIMSYEETPEKCGAIISIEPTTKVEHIEAWTESKETVDHLTKTEDLEETERKPFEDVTDKETIEKSDVSVADFDSTKENSISPPNVKYEILMEACKLMKRCGNMHVADSDPNNEHFQTTLMKSVRDGKTVAKGVVAAPVLVELHVSEVSGNVSREGGERSQDENKPVFSKSSSSEIGQIKLKCMEFQDEEPEAEAQYQLFTNEDSKKTKTKSFKHRIQECHVLQNHDVSAIKETVTAEDRESLKKESRYPEKEASVKEMLRNFKGIKTDLIDENTPKQDINRTAYEKGTHRTSKKAQTLSFEANQDEVKNSQNKTKTFNQASPAGAKNEQNELEKVQAESFERDVVSENGEEELMVSQNKKNKKFVGDRNQLYLTEDLDEIEMGKFKHTLQQECSFSLPEKKNLRRGGTLKEHATIENDKRDGFGFAGKVINEQVVKDPLIDISSSWNYGQTEFSREISIDVDGLEKGVKNEEIFFRPSEIQSKVENRQRTTELPLVKSSKERTDMKLFRKNKLISSEVPFADLVVDQPTHGIDDTTETAEAKQWRTENRNPQKTGKADERKGNYTAKQKEITPQQTEKLSNEMQWDVEKLPKHQLEDVIYTTMTPVLGTEKMEEWNPTSLFLDQIQEYKNGVPDMEHKLNSDAEAKKLCIEENRLKDQQWTENNPGITKVCDYILKNDSEEISIKQFPDTNYLQLTSPVAAEEYDEVGLIHEAATTVPFAVETYQKDSIKSDKSKMSATNSQDRLCYLALNSPSSADQNFIFGDEQMNALYLENLSENSCRDRVLAENLRKKAEYPYELTVDIPWTPEEKEDTGAKTRPWKQKFSCAEQEIMCLSKDTINVAMKEEKVAGSMVKENENSNFEISSDSNEIYPKFESAKCVKLTDRSETTSEKLKTNEVKKLFEHNKKLEKQLSMEISKVDKEEIEISSTHRAEPRKYEIKYSGITVERNIFLDSLIPQKWLRARKENEELVNQWQQISELSRSEELEENVDKISLEMVIHDQKESGEIVRAADSNLEIIKEKQTMRNDEELEIYSYGDITMPQQHFCIFESGDKKGKLEEDDAHNKITTSSSCELSKEEQGKILVLSQEKDAEKHVISEIVLDTVEIYPANLQQTENIHILGKGSDGKCVFQVQNEHETDYESDLKEKLKMFVEEKLKQHPERQNLLSKNKRYEEELNIQAAEIIDNVMKPVESISRSESSYKTATATSKDGYETCPTSQEDTFETAPGYHSQESEYTTANSEASSRLSEMSEERRENATPIAMLSPVQSDRLFTASQDEEQELNRQESIITDSKRSSPVIPDIELISVEDENDMEEDILRISASGILRAPDVDPGRPVSPIPPGFGDEDKDIVGVATVSDYSKKLSTKLAKWKSKFLTLL